MNVEDQEPHPYIFYSCYYKDRDYMLKVEEPAKNPLAYEYFKSSKTIKIKKMEYLIQKFQSENYKSKNMLAVLDHLTTIFLNLKMNLQDKIERSHRNKSDVTPQHFNAFEKHLFPNSYQDQTQDNYLYFLKQEHNLLSGEYNKQFQSDALRIYLGKRQQPILNQSPSDQSQSSFYLQKRQKNDDTDYNKLLLNINNECFNSFDQKNQTRSSKLKHVNRMKWFLNQKFVKLQAQLMEKQGFRFGYGASIFEQEGNHVKQLYIPMQKKQDININYCGEEIQFCPNSLTLINMLRHTGNFQSNFFIALLTDVQQSRELYFTLQNIRQQIKDLISNGQQFEGGLVLLRQIGDQKQVNFQQCIEITKNYEYHGYIWEQNLYPQATFVKTNPTQIVAIDKQYLDSFGDHKEVICVSWDYRDKDQQQEFHNFYSLLIKSDEIVNCPKLEDINQSSSNWNEFIENFYDEDHFLTFEQDELKELRNVWLRMQMNEKMDIIKQYKQQSSYNKIEYNLQNINQSFDQSQQNQFQGLFIQQNQQNTSQSMNSPQQNLLQPLFGRQVNPQQNYQQPLFGRQGQQNQRNQGSHRSSENNQQKQSGIYVDERVLEKFKQKQIENSQLKIQLQSKNQNPNLNLRQDSIQKQQNQQLSIQRQVQQPLSIQQQNRTQNTQSILKKSSNNDNITTNFESKNVSINESQTDRKKYVQKQSFTNPQSKQKYKYNNRSSLMSSQSSSKTVSNKSRNSQSLTQQSNKRSSSSGGNNPQSKLKANQKQNNQQIKSSNSREQRYDVRQKQKKNTQDKFGLNESSKQIKKDKKNKKKHQDDEESDGSSQIQVIVYNTKDVFKQQQQAHQSQCIQLQNQNQISQENNQSFGTKDNIQSKSQSQKQKQSETPQDQIIKEQEDLQIEYDEISLKACHQVFQRHARSFLGQNDDLFQEENYSFIDSCPGIQCGKQIQKGDGMCCHQCNQVGCSQCYYILCQENKQFCTSCKMYKPDIRDHKTIAQQTFRTRQILIDQIAVIYFNPNDEKKEEFEEYMQERAQNTINEIQKYDDGLHEAQKIPKQRESELQNQNQRSDSYNESIFPEIGLPLEAWKDFRQKVGINTEVNKYTLNGYLNYDGKKYQQYIKKQHWKTYLPNSNWQNDFEEFQKVYAKKQQEIQQKQQRDNYMNMSDIQQYMNSKKYIDNSIQINDQIQQPNEDNQISQNLNKDQIIQKINFDNIAKLNEEQIQMQENKNIELFLKNQIQKNQKKIDKLQRSSLQEDQNLQNNEEERQESHIQQSSNENIEVQMNQRDTENDKQDGDRNNQNNLQRNSQQTSSIQREGGQESSVLNSSENPLNNSNNIKDQLPKLFDFKLQHRNIDNTPSNTNIYQNAPSLRGLLTSGTIFQSQSQINEGSSSYQKLNANLHERIRHILINELNIPIQENVLMQVNDGNQIQNSNENEIAIDPNANYNPDNQRPQSDEQMQDEDAEK